MIKIVSSWWKREREQARLNELQLEHERVKEQQLEQARLKELQLEKARLEYEGIRAGIGRYDEILFRIRSWAFALISVLVVAYLGADAETSGEIRPEIALLAVTCLLLSFWILDAMNKSLQMVQIHLSHDLEEVIIHRQPYRGPSVSHRYRRRERKHLAATIRHMTDESVLPFYLLPGTASALLIWYDQFSGSGNLICPTPSQLLIIVLSAALVGLPIFASLHMKKFKLGWITWLIDGRRWRKAFWRKEVSAAIKDFGGEWEEKVFLSGYRIEFSSEHLAVFIDHRRTKEMRAYKEIRAEIAQEFGLQALSVCMETGDVELKGAVDGEGRAIANKCATELGKKLKPKEKDAELGKKLKPKEEEAEPRATRELEKDRSAQILWNWFGVVIVIAAVIAVAWMTFPTTLAVCGAP